MTNVNCFRCKKEVDKLQTRAVKGMDNQKKYECFTCYRSGHPANENVAVQEAKKNYFCGRCKYKFASRTAICPYCNESDQVDFGDVSIKDLL